MDVIFKRILAKHFRQACVATGVLCIGLGLAYFTVDVDWSAALAFAVLLGTAWALYFLRRYRMRKGRYGHSRQDAEEIARFLEEGGGKKVPGMDLD